MAFQAQTKTLPDSPKDQQVDRTNLIGKLRNKIRLVETANRVAGEARVSSGCSAIDRLLPEYGYQRGTLVQWLTGGGQAADYLSLLAAKQAALDGGAIVVFDPFHQFYPPAAAAIGISLDNLIVLKSSSSPTADINKASNEELDSDLLWSVDQALRCPAVAAVWGPMGRIDERWFRRFQLSAESSGSLGLFVQPIQQARQPSWADVQWLLSGSAVHTKTISSQPSTSQTWRSPARSEHSSEQLVRLQLTRCRGTQTGKTVNLSINTITGNVQLARCDHEQQLEFHEKIIESGTRAKRDSFVQQTKRQIPNQSHPKNPLPLASQLAHSANGRRGA